MCETEEQEIPEEDQPADRGHPAADSVRGASWYAEDTPDPSKPTGSEAVTNTDRKNTSQAHSE